MRKETITYVDYNGTERTEDFYFNLTKAELLDMQFGTVGGFDEMVTKIINTKDQPGLIKIFKDFICKAYGVKSADGRRFMKTPEILAEFVETEAYSVLYMKLATDADAAAKFINGCVPGDIAKQAAEMQAKQAKNN